MKTIEELQIENAQLKARVSELEEVVRNTADIMGGECDMPECDQCILYREARDVLNRTPAQSLASLKAGVLREFAKGKYHTEIYYAAMAEAQRLETEAGENR